MDTTILEVKHLNVTFKKKKYYQEIIKDISFHLKKGECLGILGESGSGKSMCVKAIMGLLDQNFLVDGEALYKEENLIQKKNENLRAFRGKEFSMILQNPMTCFDPLYRIGAQMEETFQAHTTMSRTDIYHASLHVLLNMQIRNPEEVLKKYSHQLSGGMLQRIMIGLAMALKPEILIADEPTTAIDSITQYEIMKEFVKIKEKHNSAMIFISHDLGVISQIADRVLVMNQGEIVDEGNFSHILHYANDPYTKELIKNKMAVMNQYRKVLGYSL